MGVIASNQERARDSLTKTQENIMHTTEADRIDFCSNEALDMSILDVIENAAYDDGYDGFPISGDMLAALTAEDRD
jgi:hypothetical protein